MSASTIGVPANSESVEYQIETQQHARRTRGVRSNADRAAAVTSSGSQLKAREIFDACHGRYRSLTEWLEEGRGRLRAVSLESPSLGYQWRPERSRACEFVADFERLGRQALRRPEWKGRLKLFEIYFMHSMEYREAVKLVGVAEGTFDYWMQEVKRACGKEFSRCGLFPPSKYFLSQHKPASSALRRAGDSEPA